jgi:hypothetical protein
MKTPRWCMMYISTIRRENIEGFPKVEDKDSDKAEIPQVH